MASGRPHWAPHPGAVERMRRGEVDALARRLGYNPSAWGPEELRAELVKRLTRDSHDRRQELLSDSNH